MNGGQVALTGFKLQVLWTLLDGFVRDDWRAVTIEPSDDEDGGLAKVDIRWELLGAERHDQVKSTVNNFGETEVRRWASELERTSTAAEKRLVLIGMASSGVRPNGVLGDVEVKVRGRDEDTLVYAAAYLMERHCREVGVRPPYGQTEGMLELIVGLLLTRASRGQRWLRDELTAEVLTLAERLRGQGPRRPMPVDPRERADRVQAAMRAHGMSRAAECRRVGDRRIYMTCEWPPPSYADPDGYHQVTVVSGEGPGQCEADGTNYADIIASNSPAIEVSYAFGSQGYYSHEPPFVARQGEVLTSDGKPYDGAHGPIGFYPDRGQIVILHNAKHLLDRVRCLADQ